MLLCYFFSIVFRRDSIYLRPRKAVLGLPVCGVIKLSWLISRVLISFGNIVQIAAQIDHVARLGVSKKILKKNGIFDEYFSLHDNRFICRSRPEIALKEFSLQRNLELVSCLDIIPRESGLDTQVTYSARRKTTTE